MELSPESSGFLGSRDPVPEDCKVLPLDWDECSVVRWMMMMMVFVEGQLDVVVL